MLRASSYNIYVPLNNSEKEFILIHGYSGALDIVSYDVYKNLKDSEAQSSSLSRFSKEEIEDLACRGFITEQTDEEEIETFKTVVNAMLNNKESKRINITIVPTYDCNFRCPYCFEKEIHSKGKSQNMKVMSRDFVDEIFTSFDKLKEEGYLISPQITLFGGEPLLRDNFEITSYIVGKSVERGFNLIAITNGYELQFFEELLGKGKIESLQITLDGKKDFHNKRRFLNGGGDTFDRIVQNVDLCLEKGAFVSLRTNVEMSNIEQLEWLIELYSQKGWTQKSNFSYHFKSVHACYEKEGKRIFDDTIVKKLSESTGKTDLVNRVPTYSALRDYFHSVFKNGTYAISKATFCSSSTGMVAIDPYGDIYPCWEVMGAPQNSIGKVEDASIVFNGNAEYWRNRNVATMEDCSKCPYALMCGGNCPAHAKVYTGDIYSSCCERFKEIFHEVLPKVYYEWIESMKLNTEG